MTPAAFAELAPASVASGGDEAPVSRGSLEAHGGDEAASAERGDLAFGEPGFLLPERDGEAAAAFRASREDTLCGDEGPLVTGAGDDDGDTFPLTEDTGAEEDVTSGTAREENTAGTAAAGAAVAAVTAAAGAGAEEEDAPDPVGFVFSASAAARIATLDGDAADLGERTGEAGFPAAARAEARVVAGRAALNADGLGSTRTDGDVGAGIAAAAAGSASTGTGTAAAAAAGAARVPAETAAEAPPERASSSVLVMLGAFALGLRLGASVFRSASPGMRPPRSVALASALAEVSSHEMSSSAPFCWRGVELHYTGGDDQIKSGDKARQERV